MPPSVPTEGSAEAGEKDRHGVEQVCQRHAATPKRTPLLSKKVHAKEKNTVFQAAKK